MNIHQKNSAYHDLPVSKILEFLKKYNSFALFDTSLCDCENHRSIICYGLDKKIQIKNCQKLKETINEVEKLVKYGYYGICILPYESGLIFESRYPHYQNLPYPCTFLFFKHNIFFDHISGKFSKNIPDKLLRKSVKSKWNMKRLWFNTPYNEYKEKIKQIKHLIKEGETYQVNYTIRSMFEFYVSAYGMYLNIRKMQNVPYSAFIKIGDRFILSFSPELFFKRDGNLITTRPMKGTIARGFNEKNDRNNIETLKKSLKDRAENIMIVDMMRNDLGRICESGSIKSEPLFHIEKYRTLFQMTSTVSGRLKKNVGLYDIFSSLFPSASVTGAPKIRTMQIISEIEKSPRKVYTGAIGMLYPDGNSIFNVAIRTILAENNYGEMGTGGGIVYDSKTEKEYKECLLKSAFLASSSPNMHLIETIRWTSQNGFFLLDLHMKRLAKSAQFFRFIFNKKNILQNLDNTAASFESDSVYKVRLLLSPDGQILISSQKISPETASIIPKIALSKHKIEAENIFLYHKTTIRHLYDKTYNQAAKKGYFDIIFKNTSNEITEGCITNVFIEKNGVLYTPPVSCGLLPGVLRTHLVKNGIAKEKTLIKDEIFKADKIFLGNSVRGLVKVDITT